MQDIHSMGGVGGSLFGDGGDRRLRPHHQDEAALKCPRCDSSNTKFCYYNNYNLSQPRHFCKSCRRYWTRGGVLRNVPVGGGCRKPKRSNKPNKTTPYTEFTTTVDKSNLDSTSESSNITATTTTVKAAFPQPLHAVSRNTPNLNPSTKTGFVSPGCGFFGEMGSWTSLMDSGDVAIGFGFGFGEDGWSNWQSGGGVLDLSDTVDQAYWSQIGVDQRSDQVQD